MANIKMAYIMFDETIKRVVQNFKLEGVVVQFDLLHLYVRRLVFDFSHRYLTIQDYIDYSLHDIEAKTVLDNTVKHLKEIDFQFRFYFNELWC